MKVFSDHLHTLKTQEVTHRWASKTFTPKLDYIKIGSCKHMKEMNGYTEERPLFAVK